MVALVLPSYWNEDSCIDPRLKFALLPDSKCEGNTSINNFYISPIASMRSVNWKILQLYSKY